MRGCQCACVSECVICVSASAIVWGWERAPGPGRGCGRCPRGGPRLGSGGCRCRRGLGGCQGGRVVFRVCGAAAGCRLRGQVLILLSPRCPCLLLPAESRCGSPGPPPCVSVCWGGSLGTRGSLSHLPRRRRRPLLTPHPGEGGRLGSKSETPGEGAGRAARLRPPTSRGRGCRSPLRSLLFGAPRLPLSLLAPGVSDWGWG